MRVLHVTNMYPTERYPKFGAFVKAQVDSLTAAGVESELWFVDGLDDSSAYVGAGLDALQRITRSQHRFDLVHVHFGINLLWCLPLKLRRPMVVSFCGGDVFGSPGPRAWKSKTLAAAAVRAARLCDLVIVKTEQMREHFKEPPPVELLPNGVDFDVFRPRRRDECCAAVGWDASRRHVLFANHPTISFQRRFDIIEAAVQRVRETHPDVALQVVYDQPQERIPLYMNAASVMVLASMMEGSPNTVKEAMACNLPVVSVDVGDCAKTVGRVDGCHLVQRTPEAFAAAIRTVLDRNERTNGRPHVEHLRIERVAQRLAELYQQVLNGGVRDALGERT